MKRVKITGFADNPKCPYPETVRKDFMKSGFIFHANGSVNETTQNLYIDKDELVIPFEASVFQYEEINEQQ